MGLIECPHCKKEATSYINLGNTFYFFYTGKMCHFCNKPVEFKTLSVFLLYFVALPAALLPALIMIGGLQYFMENYLAEKLSKIALIIILPLSFFFIIMLNILVVRIAGKHLKLRLFQVRNFWCEKCLTNRWKGTGRNWRGWRKRFWPAPQLKRSAANPWSVKEF